MNVEQKRRELFTLIFKRYNMDSFVDDDGDSVFHDDLTQGAWIGFNAALDAVEIELPSDPNEEFCDRRAAIEGCRAAIESTGLGLKVKP